MGLYNYILPTGVIVSDTSSILAEVQSEYQAAFGTDLIITPDSPQGVLITAETLSRSSVVNNNAVMANLINPNIAGGVALDAIMALTGQQRAAQTQTVVTNVSLAGVPGTVIAQGSQAQTQAGDVFATLSSVTLNSNGIAMVNFGSIAYGPIPCGPNALTMIVSNILGWETVNNNQAGSPASETTLGSTTQSDQSARALRQNTLAFQGVSLAEAITSALYNVSGVTSLSFQENISSNTQTINGISMAPHSIYACVAGGADTDVAAALLENKSSGCAWNGSTTINLVEPSSGQQYAVQFDRPAQIGILINVTISNGNAQNVTQSILDFAAGNIAGFDGFIVGADVSPFELSGAIMAENPGVFVSTVATSNLSPINFSSSVIPIGVNQQAYTQQSYINVTIA